MEGMYSVPLSELIEKMGLENLTPGIDTENILIPLFLISFFIIRYSKNETGPNINKYSIIVLKKLVSTLLKKEMKKVVAMSKIILKT